MKFDTAQEALTWYFNRPWVRPPADARSMVPLKISTSPRMENTEALMATFMMIEKILEDLAPRDWCILRGEFHRKGPTQSELAETFSLSGDRSVRYIRDKVIKKLEENFRKQRILSDQKYARPVIMHE